MLKYLLVFLGGGIGSMLRYLIGPAVQGLISNTDFPLGTFVVNVTGCAIIGVLAGLAESRSLFSMESRLFVFVGIMGGYTTFSTFGLETFQLLRDGEFLFAALNVAGQVFVGLLVLWLGFNVARLL